MATEWMLTVKRVMQENPTLAFKDVLKQAKKEYKPSVKKTGKVYRKKSKTLKHKKMTKKSGKKSMRKKHSKKN